MGDGTPELRETRHVFLELPNLEERLTEYVDAASSRGGWSSNCLTTTRAWLANGLKQRCITRDLRWGTPVPRPGFESKCFYVWFDAPIGYGARRALNSVAPYQSVCRLPP